MASCNSMALTFLEPILKRKSGGLTAALLQPSVTMKSVDYAFTISILFLVIHSGYGKKKKNPTRVRVGPFSFFAPSTTFSS